MRWLLIFLIAFVLFNGLGVWLRRFGLGRLPGDFRLRLGKRELYLPVASSLVLSFIAMLVGQLL